MQKKKWNGLFGVKINLFRCQNHLTQIQWKECVKGSSQYLCVQLENTKNCRKIGSEVKATMSKGSRHKFSYTMIA